MIGPSRTGHVAHSRHVGGRLKQSCAKEPSEPGNARVWESRASLLPREKSCLVRCFKRALLACLNRDRKKPLNCARKITCEFNRLPSHATAAIEDLLRVDSFFPLLSPRSTLQKGRAVGKSFCSTRCEHFRHRAGVPPPAARCQRSARSSPPDPRPPCRGVVA